MCDEKNLLSSFTCAVAFLKYFYKVSRDNFLLFLLVAKITQWEEFEREIRCFYETSDKKN